MQPDLVVTPVTGAIGAVVSDVKLADPLPAETVQALRDALHEHQVLFFHDQDLTDEEHVAFAENFGTVSPYAFTKMLGGTSRATIIEDTADNPPDGDTWHTDVTWVAEPPAYAFLNALIIPAVGGDTMWSSLFAAYDALSPTMQGLCDGLTVVHRPGPEFRAAIERTQGTEVADRVMAEFPPVEHPLVRRHPVTGRPALYVSAGFMDHVVGMHREESDALLGFLARHAENPNFCVRWRWTEHDLAVWDEASTNHRALADHYPQHRRMRRCTVDGPRPV